MFPVSTLLYHTHTHTLCYCNYTPSDEDLPSATPRGDGVGRQPLSTVKLATVTPTEIPRFSNTNPHFLFTTSTFQRPLLALGFVYSAHHHSTGHFDKRSNHVVHLDYAPNTNTCFLWFTVTRASNNRVLSSLGTKGLLKYELKLSRHWPTRW